MNTFSTGKLCLLAMLLASFNLFAAEAVVLNHDFEYDTISEETGKTTNITGWVSRHTGTIGIHQPLGDGVHFNNIANQQQVAYLDAGGRINQATDLILSAEKSYTLTFDAGYHLEQVGQNFVVRIMADGLVQSQVHSNQFNMQPGEWGTYSITHTTTNENPLGKPVIVEFQNLATTTGFQVNIDNVRLTDANAITASNNPGVGVIDEDTTLLVPSQFANINKALDYLKRRTITVGATVTIQVDDCTNQVYDQPILANHDNGRAIEIVSGLTYPEECILQFNGSHGIVVSNGYTLGMINGFTLQGNQTPGTVGLLADKGSSIPGGYNMKAIGFDDGVKSNNGSFIYTPFLNANNNIGTGFMASKRAMVDAYYGVAEYNKNGFQSIDSSFVYPRYAKASFNQQDGFNINNNSVMHSEYSESFNNDGSGYVATNHSIGRNGGANSYNNLEFGTYAGEYGYITGVSATNNGTNHSPHYGPGNNNGLR